ncbi:methionyl-tRNA formyltransferase [Alteromonas sp. CYL-A6]|uniref:methionyl-tRNA formyltransferase n=1 Tax=Alteromonas nitratireducens TaxID=3390813 RepID=UPI0034A6D9E0
MSTFAANFFLMNSKGLHALNAFIEVFGESSVSSVVSSKDLKLKSDSFEEIKSLCKKKSISFHERGDRSIKELDESDTVTFAIGWRWLIPNCNKLIVFHDSLLPKYRGFAPLVNCLVNGETEVGVTALYASEDYDAGEIIAQKSLKISYPLKIAHAIELIEPLYSELVIEIFQKIISGSHLSSKRQCTSAVTYSPWLDEDDYFIDWRWSSEKIIRFIDAVGFPYDGAKSIVDDLIVNIYDAELVKDVVVEDRKRHIGKVIFFKDAPVVVCGDGLVKLNRVCSDSGQLINLRFRSRFR